MNNTFGRERTARPQGSRDGDVRRVANQQLSSGEWPAYLFISQLRHADRAGHGSFPENSQASSFNGKQWSNYNISVLEKAANKAFCYDCTVMCIDTAIYYYNLKLDHTKVYLRCKWKKLEWIWHGKNCRCHFMCDDSDKTVITVNTSF